MSFEFPTGLPRGCTCSCFQKWPRCPTQETSNFKFFCCSIMASSSTPTMPIPSQARIVRVPADNQSHSISNSCINLKMYEQVHLLSGSLEKHQGTAGNPDINTFSAALQSYANVTECGPFWAGFSFYFNNMSH